jgi:hypothetical protein
MVNGGEGPILFKKSVSNLRFTGSWCQAGQRLGIGIGLASFRRFWAVAARRNSRPPFGPLSLSRSSLRMRLRWANSISTLRNHRAVRPCHQFAIWRAMSRAPS